MDRQESSISESLKELLSHLALPQERSESQCGAGRESETRMGQKQHRLCELLGRVGAVSDHTLPFPRVEDVAESSLTGEIDRVYRLLGGVLTAIPLNLHSWDLEFDGMAVELDEDLHFNRYRGITLSSVSYLRLPCFPLSTYRQYCSEHEQDCLDAGTFGRRWSTLRSIDQFGPASTPGNLSGGGSPRWKQRAFYDFVNDLSPLLVDVTVVRLAVWDKVVEHGENRTIGEVLISPSDVSSAALVDLVRVRAKESGAKESGN